MSDKWWSLPCRISDLQFTPSEVETIGPRGVAQLLKGIGFNAQHLAFLTLGGGEATFLRGSWGVENYRVYVEEAHKAGIRVVAYLNIHWLLEEDALQHPDWTQKCEDGKPPVIHYGRGYTPCVNTPWREYSFQKARELIEGFRIDGVFLDGPSFRPHTCYCQACSEKFKRIHGSELPSWANWKDPDWRRFIEFRFSSIEAYVKDMRKAVKEANPEAVIYMNNRSLGSTWLGGSDTRHLAKHLDMLGNERSNIFGTSPLSCPLWMPGAAAKILEAQADGKPYIVYICFRHLPWDYYGLTPAELKPFIAEVVANGAYPQIMGGMRYLDKPLSKVVKEMFHFITSYEQYFNGTESAAQTAVLWSTATANYYGVESPPNALVKDWSPSKDGGMMEEFYGVCEALFRSHVPFAILDEECLTPEKLEKYQCVILPNASCLASTSVDALTQFVEQGGRLVATGETSLYNEYGGFLGDFSLSKVLGCTFDNEIFGPLPFDYIQIETIQPWTQGITRELLPAPTVGLSVKPTNGKVCASYYEKLPSRYFPIKMPQVQKPALIVNEFGRGTSIYFVGNFASAYWHNRFPEYRLMIRNASTSMIDQLIEVNDASQTLDIVPRRKVGENRLLIHLINFTGEMSRPIEKILPVKDVRLTVRGIREIDEAKTLWSNKSLKPKEKKAKSTTFIIPLIREYELIIL